MIADISHSDENADCKSAVIQRELLMEETLPASAKANVEALYKQSEKLRFLIDSLVKLPDWKMGSFLCLQRTALQPLLQGIVEQYAAKVSEKGLSLQMRDTDALLYSTSNGQRKHWLIS